MLSLILFTQDGIITTTCRIIITITRITTIIIITGIIITTDITTTELTTMDIITIMTIIITIIIIIIQLITTIMITPMDTIMVIITTIIMVITITVITIIITTTMITITTTLCPLRIIIEETRMRMLLLIDGSGEKTFRKSRDVSLFAKLTVLTFLELRLSIVLLKPRLGTCPRSDVVPTFTSVNWPQPIIVTKLIPPLPPTP